MSDRFYVATRKGVFTVDRDTSGSCGSCSISRSAFLAENSR